VDTSRRIRIVSAVAVTATLVGVGAVVGLNRHASRSSAHVSPVRANVPGPREPHVEVLPQAPRSALAIPNPRPLQPANSIAWWAPVSQAAVVRRLPSVRSTIIGHLSERTPEGTQNIVSVIGRKSDHGRLWIHVRIPMLPNNTIGWVYRTSLGGYSSVRTALVVDLKSETLTLLRDGHPIFRSRVGIGKPGWPTPRGTFYVRDKLTNYKSAFYGPVAFGTSARSAVATDWPAGGFIGIHGTDDPGLLPGRVSHGCIRMRNTEIVALARLLPIGTPITIH
jgi:hypothetical protein